LAERVQIEYAARSFSHYFALNSYNYEPRVPDAHRGGSYMIGFFRLQANVVDVVAQVERRVLNHAIGKQFMALSHEA